MAIIDDFKTRFPEFDTDEVDTYLPPLVDTYECLYNWSYDDCNEEAILQLLAHMLVSETAGSSAAMRAESSKSVGSVSISYADITASASAKRSWLLTTRYGMRFLALVSHRGGGFFI